MRKSMVSKVLKFSGTTILARTAGWALALAAVGAWLPGCERDDPVATTIRSTTIDLAAMSPGASASVAPDLDAQSYKKIIADLKGVSGKGGDGQQAAVDLLTARATFGLAGQSAAGVADTEQAALRSVSGVRAALQSYLAYSAQAAALSQYDPAPFLADLDKQTTACDAELAKARKVKQDIDSRIAALKAQAQAKADQAAAEHKAEAELRETAIRVSNTEAAELIVQANQHRRVADGFDAEASTLDAQAAQIAPQSPEAQLLIDQMVRQKEQLGRARQEIIQHDADNRELATKAKASQAEAAEAVDAAVKALAAARAELPGKYEEAQRLYREAAGLAAKAIKANRSQANLAVGEANQASGGLHWRRAQGLDTVAAMLEVLAGAKPALPSQSDYAAQATEARTAQKASLDAATEAYDLAKTAFQGSGAANRLEEVDKGLAEIILKTSGGSLDRRGTEEPADSGEAPAPSSDAPIAAADSPQTTIDAVFNHLRNAEFERIPEYLYLPDAQTKALVDSALVIIGKAKALNSAVTAKFGKGLWDGDAMAGFQQGMAGGMADLNSFSSADLTITVTGDTARATKPGEEGGLDLRKVDGKWLIDGSEAANADPEQMAMVTAMLPQVGVAIDEMTAEVNAGKYKTVEEFNQALMARMMGMMGQVGGPNGPGGGGG